MKERGVGKPWTQHEDSLLTQAVAVYGANDNWKNVASCVPGRTNKACRKRWLHSLCPSVKKTAWTAEEDQLLLSLYAKHGTKWSVIARQIPGRTDDACSKRYREALDPSLKRDEWTPEEDRYLLQVYDKLGVKWGQVGQRLNRSGLACRNRWRMLERRKAHTVQVSDHNSPPAVDRQTPESDESSAAMQPSWDLGMPFIDSADYWASQPSYTAPPTILPEGPDDIQLHPPAYPYPADLEPGEIIEGFTNAPPPPFRFTSSSLSSALSLSAISPSTAHVGSPSNHVPEVSINNTNANGIQCSNLTNSQVSSGTTFADEVDQTDTQQFYNPPSPRYSPDLCALESQDISLPVPFDDTQQDCDPTYDTALPASQPVREGLQPYPTPEASPHLDQSSATLASPTHSSSQEADRDPARHYRTPAQKRAAELRTGSGVTKKPSQKNTMPRLCASLPASSDRSVLAYVCGHEACWPATESASASRYTTSQELYDHWKLQHVDNSSCERPYRCGIEGCGKGWKSINGLQYHLQLSKAHFQQAISATLTRRVESAAADAADAPTGGLKKKLFTCTFPNCPNQYKQMSGLRYHLAHGHSQQLPTQLDYVPPALARKVADKLQGRVSLVSVPPLSSSRPGQ